MSLFDDREKAFEAKYELDREREFKEAARRDKLFGLWVAQRLGLSEAAAAAYARAMVEAEIATHDVVAKAMGDLDRQGVSETEASLRQRLESCAHQAREQIAREMAAP